MRPLIGIPCHAGERKDTSRPIYYNNRAYIRAVEHAGGTPVLIPLLEDLSGLHALLPHLNGLLLSGGVDIEPRYYHENPHPQLGETDPQLDEMELALARYALESNLPTLGVCRGMQLLNVALGGSLYQDLHAQYPGSLHHANPHLPRNTIIHGVQVERGSRMEGILGARKVVVNSLHHQAIKQPGRGVCITGRAEDGVAELMEVPGHRFMLAAQCHPEELYAEHLAWSRLFKAFIDACTKGADHHYESEPLEHILTPSAV
jgi:putative glutamine amidotransferase